MCPWRRGRGHHPLLFPKRQHATDSLWTPRPPARADQTNGTKLAVYMVAFFGGGFAIPFVGAFTCSLRGQPERGPAGCVDPTVEQPRHSRSGRRRHKYTRGGVAQVEMFGVGSRRARRPARRYANKRRRQQILLNLSPSLSSVDVLPHSHESGRNARAQTGWRTWGCEGFANASKVRTKKRDDWKGVRAKIRVYV